MIKKLIQFSLDLYDIESGAIVSVESDHLIIFYCFFSHVEMAHENV